MAFMLIEATSTVTVADHKSLLTAWKIHGGPGSLVGRFIVEKPLTRSQLRRLPMALKEKMACPDDSVSFLERLYGLEDPRG
jgi:hypothetical protein